MNYGPVEEEKLSTTRSRAAVLDALVLVGQYVLLRSAWFSSSRDTEAYQKTT